MKMILLLIIMTVGFGLAAEQDIIIGNWTNGEVVYTSTKNSDNVYIFNGISLHEGGIYFTIQRNPKDDTFTIVGALPNSTDYVSFGNVGDIASFQNVNGQYVLIARNSNGTITDFLRPFAQEENHRELRFRNKLNFELAGKYTSQTGDKQIVFHPNTFKVEGLHNLQTFDFVTDLHIPINVLTFEDGQHYMYQKTVDGLNIYSTEKDDLDLWQKKELLYSLTKMEWFNPFEDKGLHGKYPYASTEFLIDDILVYLTKEELRIMRNEIFARHGYKFRSEDLKTHFGQQDWYKPQFDDVTDKLSELEKLNIELILRAENKLAL